MTRDEAIQVIGSLYPADIHEAGKELLLEALCNCWRALPDNILFEYMRLCEEKEARAE